MEHYCYGSGMFGCLYDYGPNFCEELEDAIEGIMLVFEDCVSEAEAAGMRTAFRSGDTSWHFENPSEAGAQYAEISVCNGPCPDAEDD